MSRSRWAVSLFLVGHLIAITLGALPPPDKLPSLDVVREASADPIAMRFTPALDRATALFSQVPKALWDASGTFRRPADVYLSVTGLGQRWNMFSNPPRVDQYVRLRYYVTTTNSRAQPDRPSWVVTELVFPAHREDRVRLLQSYRDSYRDKAIAVALQHFFEHWTPDLIRPDVRSSQLPDDLAPICRYFSRQFQRGHLLPDERIVRTEAWYGAAAIPRDSSTPDAGERRMAVLREYYLGPREQRFRESGYPPYHALEHEADIEWTLAYFEQP